MSSELTAESKTNEELALSVVVLAYNEETTIEDCIARVVAVCEDLKIAYEVVIVEDGSTDRTPQITQRLCADNPRVRCVHHPVNCGSGRAIRSGVEASRGERIIYVPADGQFDFLEIGRFLHAAELADIVIGARLSRHDYTSFRLLSSGVFLALVRLLFGTTFRDVNWVHLWHRRVFENISVRSEGVFLLEEIIVRAARKGCSFVEIESVYQPRQGGEATGGNPRTILKTLKEMAAVRIEMWVS